MKCLRLLLIMVISVAIPMNGFAAAPVSPCPMQSPAHLAALDDSATEAAEILMDCCEDMHKQPQGKCKSGQACSLSGVYFVLPIAFQIFPPDAGIATAAYTTPRVSEPPTAIWHPPQPA